MTPGSARDSRAGFGVLAETNFSLSVARRIVEMRVSSVVLGIAVTAAALTAAEVRDPGVPTVARERLPKLRFDASSQTESITVAQIAQTPAQLRLA